jgi:hypothetical protein
MSRIKEISKLSRDEVTRRMPLRNRGGAEPAGTLGGKLRAQFSEAQARVKDVVARRSRAQRRERWRKRLGIATGAAAAGGAGTYLLRRRFSQGAPVTPAGVTPATPAPQETDGAGGRETEEATA